MRRTTLIALAVFLGLLVWMLTFSKDGRQKLQSFWLSVRAPFMKAKTSVQESLAGGDKHSKISPAEMRKLNRFLEKEVKRLSLENKTLRDFKKNYERLRYLVEEYQPRSVFKLVHARIIARNTDTWWSTLVIDRGLEDGIASDLPVVTDVGLVGKTATVSPNSSIVLLLTDEKCRVAAKIEGSRDRGILMGIRGATRLAPDLKLRYVSKDANPKRGTRVYSTGKGGVFPSNLLLGVVKSFRPVDDLYGEATVQPAVDFQELDDVFVIVGIK